MRPKKDCSKESKKRSSKLVKDKEEKVDKDDDDEKHAKKGQQFEQKQMCIVQMSLSNGQQGEQQYHPRAAVPSSED